MTLSCIVAMTDNRVIGDGNEIPWYLPEDFKWFKKHTLNHSIIMGRKCFESIGRALPKRTNIIVTRDMFYLAEGCIITHTINEALQVAQQQEDTEEIFIIGGGEIYRQTIGLCNKLYLTEVHTTLDGEVIFPDLDLSDWQLIYEEKRDKDEKHAFAFTFKILIRK